MQIAVFILAVASIAVNSELVYLSSAFPILFSSVHLSDKLIFFIIMLDQPPNRY